MDINELVAPPYVGTIDDVTVDDKSRIVLPSQFREILELRYQAAGEESPDLGNLLLFFESYSVNGAVYDSVRIYDNISLRLNPKIDMSRLRTTKLVSGTRLTFGKGFLESHEIVPGDKLVLVGNGDHIETYTQEDYRLLHT